MLSRPLRLGTRRSPLALAQSGTVARALEKAHPGLQVELVELTTRGDTTPGDLAPLGGKGLFTAELEAGLVEGRLDLAVHSLKDLPVETRDELEIAAYPERADARDVLLSDESSRLEELPAGTLVLTGALRRQAQVRALRPDLEVESIRGNVGTRIGKWRERPGSALILAAAGLDRLGLLGGESGSSLPAHPVAPDRLIPAPGQGVLALQVRADSEAQTLCRALDHAATAEAARAERLVVAAFGGNCALPLAAWARASGDEIRLTAFLGTADGRHVARGDAAARTGAEAAEACVAMLRERGADEILARIAG